MIARHNSHGLQSRANASGVIVNFTPRNKRWSVNRGNTLTDESDSSWSVCRLLQTLDHRACGQLTSDCVSTNSTQSMLFVKS
jgi:hypothetical protein